MNTEKSELSLLALANVQALAAEGGGTSTYYCCGSTGTCASGTTSTGQSIEIRGKSQTTPCK